MDPMTDAGAVAEMHAEAKVAAVGLSGAKIVSPPVVTVPK